jgi:hypothetical protein
MQTQATAAAYCKSLARGGHCDWRLPTRIELVSLVDYARAAPPLMDDTHFDADENAFWTSSPAAADPVNLAWVVNFENGLVEADFMVTTLLDVRCVR